MLEIYEVCSNHEEINLLPFLSSAFVDLSEVEVSIIVHNIKLCYQLKWHCNSILSEFVKNEAAIMLKAMKKKLLWIKLVQSMQGIHSIEYK